MATTAPPPIQITTASTCSARAMATSSMTELASVHRLTRVSLKSGGRRRALRGSSSSSASASTDVRLCRPIRQAARETMIIMIDYIGPIPQLPGLLGIYFYVPNGIRLEFACQPEDGETPAVISCITQTKAEARAELETLPGVLPEWIEKRLTCLPE